MNLLDVVLVAAAAAAGVAGWRLGFTTRVLSWVGLAVGLLVGVKALGWVLDRLTDVDHAQLTVVALAVLLAGAVLGQSAGLALGARFAPRPRRGAAVRLDRAAGAAAGVIGVVAVIWLLLPLLAATTGWPGEATAHSRIARAIATDLPTAPDATKVVESLVGPDRFPALAEDLDPVGHITPPAASGLSTATTARVAHSVVKVEGVSCQRVQDGSGFVVEPGLVVTNAHVVAGERSTTVIRDDGARRKATVVAFDPERDLALLSVADLDRPVLSVGTAEVDEHGGVFGHPQGKPLLVAPFSVERQVDATTQDIYGHGQVQRQVLELAATLVVGDSGSALVDPAGHVVGVAFAISTDRPDLAYALSTSELHAVLAAPHSKAVSTQACAA